jgi:hypothetical protein
MSAVLDAALANVYPLRKAQADAADALAGLLDYARTINLPAASEAHAALHTALKARGSRFAQTSCSQCGCDLGPGDAGVSCCVDHIKLQRPVAAPISPAYAEFRSEFLGGNVRIGYEWHDAQDHFFMPSLAGVELNEILVGGIDLGQHLVNTTLSVIEAELREHLAAVGAW